MVNTIITQTVATIGPIELSAKTENIKASAATQMQVPLYDETIKPWLFTTHMLGWKGFFYVKGVEGVTVKGSVENLSAVFKSAAILVGYTIVFLGIAIWYFRKKDILS